MNRPTRTLNPVTSQALEKRHWPLVMRKPALSKFSAIVQATQARASSLAVATACSSLGAEMGSGLDLEVRAPLGRGGEDGELGQQHSTLDLDLGPSGPDGP